MFDPVKQDSTQKILYNNYHEDLSLAKHTYDLSAKFSIEVLELVDKAFGNAKLQGYREVTPEIVLQTLLSFPDYKTKIETHTTKSVEISIETKKENTKIVLLSTQTKKLLLLSYLLTQKLGREFVEIDDLILAILQFPAFEDMFRSVDMAVIEKSIIANLGGSTNSYQMTNTPLLNKYSIDLTQLAASGKLDEVIGRDSEIQRVIQILTRQTKSNAVLLGEAGVGKTAIVEGLAKLIYEEKTPDALRGVRILSINLVSLLSAASSYTRAENVMESIIEEVKQAGNIILFIDELHTITGGGQSNEANSISNILKPALARGELHMIGATTLSEYRKYIEKDPALSRRFEPVKVDEPDIETAVKILSKVAQKLEEFHNVKIDDTAIRDSVILSKRYIQDRHLPDKAIDLLDEASSKIALENKTILTSEDIRDIISNRTGIPVNSLSADDQSKLSNLEELLSQSVIGQPHGIHVVSEAIRRARAGLKDPNKPTGSFLFLGPSGVGKTELAKVLAREIYNTEKALIRLDMSEFSEQHTVQRLVGAPPGYVGYDEGGQLTNPVWEQPYSLILLDEIEKAHPKVFDIFLQVLDDGRLTDGQGRTVDFKNTIIIATSNIASSEIMEEIKKAENKETLSSPEFIENTIIPILRDYFRPEFINRFDEVVVFNPLGIEELVQIAKLQIKKIQKRLEEKGIKIEVSDETLRNYATEAYNPDFGARPLKRLLQDRIENVVAKSIIEGKIKEGDSFKI